MKYGACGMQGWRNTMEDSHIACITLDDNTCVFGVFDGHGGKISLINPLIDYFIRQRSCFIC